MTATARRGVRVDDETWAAAMRRAELEHRTVSQVVQVALRAYADGRYDAIEPARTHGIRRASHPR
jgi:Arc/MetJ family transcription regulator